MSQQRLEGLRRHGRQFTVVATCLWLVFGLLEHGYQLRWSPLQDALHVAADYAVVGAYVFGIVVRALLLGRAAAPLRRLWIDALFLVFALFLAWTLHAGTAAVINQARARGLEVQIVWPHDAQRVSRKG